MESGTNVILEKKNLVISEECSKRISSLRFILACLVVMFHNNKTVLFALSEGALSFSNSEFWTHIVQFLFQFLFTISPVPLFYIFSSYIQYKKNDSYLVLLKKRLKTLFLPVILWPTIVIGFRILSKLVLIFIFPDKVSHELPFVSEWGFTDWVAAFFGDYFSGKTILCEPFILPLYFIRDLFILIVVSPIIKKFVDKFPISYGIFILAVYFYNIRPIIVCTNALVFYSLGFYFAKYDFNFFKFADKITFRQISIVTIPSMYFFIITLKPEINLLISCLIMLKISKFIVECNERTFCFFKHMSEYSFFLYAIHLPYLLMFFTLKWFDNVPRNFITDLLEYFVVGSAVCIIGTFIGMGAKKLFPRFYALLTGGR